MCKKCRNCKGPDPIYYGYLSIVITGVVTLIGICGVAFAFSSVKNVDFAVNQGSKIWDNIPILNGIQCNSKKKNGQDYEYCTEITNILYNISLTNTAYQCNNKILDDKKYIHPSRQVTGVVIQIWLFACLYCFWAVIHDCGLLYKRNNMDDIKYYPMMDGDISCILEKNTIANYIDSKIINMCIRIIAYGLGLMIVYPLSFLAELLKVTLILPFKDPFYISSFSVGLYRTALVFSINFFVVYAYTFTVSLDYYNKKCSCVCVYTLDPINTFLCFFTIYGTMIGSYFASTKWYQALSHNQPYLYLIQYSLPLHIAMKINKKNPTSIDFEKLNQPLIRGYTNIISSDTTAIKSESLFISDHTNLESNQINDTNKINRKHPALFWFHVVTVFFTVAAPFGIPLQIGATNYYQLSNWTATMSLIIGIIGFIIAGCLALMLYKKYNDDINRKS